MRLSCPQCHTEYEVPDSALAGRVRTLRCADCGAQFKGPELPAVVEPEPEVQPESPPEPLPPEAAAPEAETVDAPEPVAPPKLAAVRTSPITPKPPAPKPMRAAPDRALGISILVVLLIIAVILAEHRAIGHAWPPSLRLFNALGLH